MAKKHLEIIQSTNGVETVTTSCISKLYAMAYEDAEKGIESELDASSDVQGRLSVVKAFHDQVKYLAGIEASDPKRFNNLFISVTGGYYIDFADQNMLNLLLGRGLGDTIGITESEAALATLASISDADIETFDELKYFTAINNLNGFFKNCYSLRKVTFPGRNILLNGNVFANSNANTECQDIDVDWNGATLTPSGAAKTLFYRIKGLTWKDSLVPQQTDLTNLYLFDACKSIDRVIFREGITKTSDAFHGNTNLSYVEFPSTITDMGSIFHLCRDGRSLSALVIKAVTPPTWTYRPNDNTGSTGGFGYAKLPTAIYVPDNSVNAYKNVTPLSIGTGTNEVQYAWCTQTIIDKIKPMSEMSQGDLDMGTVTQEDINRT